MFHSYIAMYSPCGPCPGENTIHMLLQHFISLMWLGKCTDISLPLWFIDEAGAAL
jgi:hypothetical protein